MSRRHSSRDTDQTRVMDQTPPSMDDARLHAEAEAWIDRRHAELLAAGTPVSKRFLRQQLIREWEREERAEDQAAVITFMRGGEVQRSVPVDPMAEHIVRRLAG